MDVKQPQRVPSLRPQQEDPSRRRSSRPRWLPKSTLPNEYDLWWYKMPRGRGQGRGRSHRRGRSSDRKIGTRRVAGKAWTGGTELLGPPADPQLPSVTTKFVASSPPPTAVAQFLPDRPLMMRLSPSAEDCSQDSTLLSASWSAVVKCHLKADIGQFLQNEGRRSHPATDSEGANVHFSFDTKLLPTNIRRSSTGGESSAYRSAPLSPESFSETSAQSFVSDPDESVHSQTVSKGRPQSTFVNRYRHMSSEKQDKAFFADHNDNFLSPFTSGSNVDVLQSDSENSVGASSPCSKHQYFHSKVPSTLTAVSGNSPSSVVYCSKEARTAENKTTSKTWAFAPPLEVPQVWPVPFDRPTKQNVDFITRTGSASASLDDQCLEQYAKMTSHQSRNTSTLFSHCGIPKWRLKPPPKRYMLKLRHVKSENAPLKRIQKDECSGVLTALEQGFSIFCAWCRRPGRMHPRNQNRIIKRRSHRKYCNNLNILKSQKLSKIAAKNGDIKCCSCHRILWKHHKNKSMFKMTEMTPNSHHALVSNFVANETEEITGIGEPPTEDTMLETVDKVQNRVSLSSDKEFVKNANTTSEDDGAKFCTNVQHLNQHSDSTSKLKLQNVTLVVCLASERDTETIVESQRVQVPCQTGQEFMEMSNKSNPYPYKISGIFGSENGISACLEDKGDLSNEFDFDINNSGELTLPSYEAQLVVSKDKAETLNFGDNSVFLTVMCKHRSCAKDISRYLQTGEMSDPLVDFPQLPLDNAGEQLNSGGNTHRGSNEAPVEKISSNRNETIGHKNSNIQTKERNSGTDHPDTVTQNGNAGGQLTSAESIHSGSNQASAEEIPSDMNETVVRNKNDISNMGMIPNDHEIGSSIIMPQTFDNVREQLNSTEKTQREANDAQLGEISPVMNETLGHNEGSGQSSTMDACEETKCFVCLKQENDNSTLTEEITACGNSSVPFSSSTTVKEEKVKEEKVKVEAVKDEVEGFGPDGVCYFVNCFMCAEERKQKRRLSATTNTGPVVVAKLSSTSEDKLVPQSSQTDISSAKCSSDANGGINNSSGEVEKLLVQSSNSSANNDDVTVSDNEELNRGVGSSRNPEKTAEELPDRTETQSLGSTEPESGQQKVTVVTELQEPVNSPHFICSDNTNFTGEKVAEQVDSLSSNSNEAFDCVASEHETDEVEDQLRNLFSENSENSCTSEFQINVAVGSVMFVERDGEHGFSNIQEELSELDVPHGRDGIAHEDGFQPTCDITSTNESQNGVNIEVEHELTTENTEDSHNAENEVNNNMSSVIPHEENAEYSLCDFHKELVSNNPPTIEHEDEQQQDYDTSSTNENQNSLIMKYESYSDQEYGNCFSDSETDSDSDASVQIITEIIRSKRTLNNQSDGRPLHTSLKSPLNSPSSEDTSEFVGSGCSLTSPMIEMKYPDHFLTNEVETKPEYKSPLRSFNIKEAVNSDFTCTLDGATIRHSEDASNNQQDRQVSKYPQNRLNSGESCDTLDLKCASTLARTPNNSVDCDTSSTAESIHGLKTTTDFPEISKTGIRVSIPLSSITDPGLLESLLSKKAAGRRNLEKSNDAWYSPTSKSKSKALSRHEKRRRMNGRGKRTFEKVSQAKEVDDQSSLPDLPSQEGSDKKHENDDARDRDVIESSSSATTKYRGAPDNNEKQSAKEVCELKNAHQSAVVAQYEDVSDGEGELQICEEPLEGDEEEEADDDNSEENAARIHTGLSHEDIFEEKWSTSEHLYESDTLIKAQDIESSNLIAQQKDDDLEAPHSSCGNKAAQLESQAVTSIPVEQKVHCKRKLFTEDRDESQMIISSNVLQRESLSPPQKLPEIKQPCSPLQKVEQHFSSNNMSSETSRPILSSDGNLSDVKAKEAMEIRYCDSSDMPVHSFDESSNKLTYEHRISAEDTATPFVKVSRKTVHEKDVHGNSSEEQDVKGSHSSVLMNKVVIYSPSKSSTRRISKARIKNVDLDSLPPSYRILRRDLNEVLEQEKLCQPSYSLPRKVPKKLSVPKAGGYRRPRECQKVQMINNTEESVSKKIRREEPDDANSEVSVEDQKKLSVQEETKYMQDHNSDATKKLCHQDTDLTAMGNADGNQQQKKKKPPVVQPEEMEVCHDNSALPEKESVVSPVCQLNLPTNERKKCTVRLKRCDGSSWIQCANESTVTESGDISSEKTSTSDECSETRRIPEKNIAAEHTSSQEIDDHGGKSSVLSRHSETEMENNTNVTKEQMNGHPKQLLNKKNSSQKVRECADKSPVFAGRKDNVNPLLVEDKVHHSPSSKPVEVKVEAVCNHGHQLSVETSHSQHKKLSLAENKNRNDSNICATGEQSQQCISQSPDEITAPENNVNTSNQATPCSSPVHHQSGQDDFAKKDRDNRQQDNSVNCGITEEGEENNRSPYRVAASCPEDQAPQRGSESPHFENSDSNLQETAGGNEQHKSTSEMKERLDELLSLLKKGKFIEDSDKKERHDETVALLTHVLREIKDPQKMLHQLLQERIQTDQHVSTSEAPCEISAEKSVPEQSSQQDRQSPIKQPVSACEEINEQHIAQKPLEKSATDSQDPVEKLSKSHLCEADSQDVILDEGEPSSCEVEQSPTENGTVSPAQHTERESQIHDVGLKEHTSQPQQQTVTGKQFLPEESQSCSGHLKQYSKSTFIYGEETTKQQKADQQYLIQHSIKERQPSQEKDVESQNPQPHMLTQQQLQDQHRVMLNTIKQQKQQYSSMQQIAQQKETKCHKELQQSSLQHSVIQTRATVQQWHHMQQRTSHHHQTQCMDIDKAVPQQQCIYSGPSQAEKVASTAHNAMVCHQTLLQQQQQQQHQQQQQQQLQRLASLEQQPLRQLAAMPNPMEQSQQNMQQQMEWQQQRAAHHISKPHPTVEHQTVPQNQQLTHPYQQQLYYPHIQQHYQVPQSTEMQMRPNYPHPYHSRLNSPQTWNSNSHLARQVPCGPLDGQQLQQQQQQYSQLYHQQQLEKWHSSRRPGTDAAATVPAVMASPSMSGGTVVESEHDRRRILSREAINSFDTGQRIGAVSSSSCPVTPANTENIHTPQVHPPQAYMRAAPQPQPNHSAAPVQAPVNTGTVHQRSMKVVPSSTVDQDQLPVAHGGRLKIPTPPVVSAFVERVMKGYQPDILSTEDIYRHQYKLAEREWAARFVLPQDSLLTRHGTTTVQQLPYGQPVMMFPDHTRVPASPTQLPLYKTVHAIGQPPHRVVVPPPTSSFGDSVNNSPVNLHVNCVHPTPLSSNENVHHHSERTASSSNRISQEVSLPSARDSENLSCDCNVIDLSRDKNTPEDKGKCHIVKWRERIPRGTELHHSVMEKSNSTSSSKAVSEVTQPSHCMQDNIPDKLQDNNSATKTVHHSVSVVEKCKSETLCGTPEKRLCQDLDSKARALPSTPTHQVTAVDLSPSTAEDCSTTSTPSQSSPHTVGASYPQLCDASRPALDSKQHAMDGKDVNCGQQNQELCTVSCCERNRCATHTRRHAAAGSTCCGTTQPPQQSLSDER